MFQFFIQCFTTAQPAARAQRTALRTAGPRPRPPPLPARCHGNAALPEARPGHFRRGPGPPSLPARRRQDGGARVAAGGVRVSAGGGAWGRGRAAGRAGRGRARVRDKAAALWRSGAEAPSGPAGGAGARSSPRAGGAVTGPRGPPGPAGRLRPPRGNRRPWAGRGSGCEGRARPSVRGHPSRSACPCLYFFNY